MEKNKITIELHSILKDVVRNLWVVVLCALIGYMGIFIVSHKIYTPEYTAKATLVVNNKGSNGSVSALTVTNEMANVLINVFSQPPMKNSAAAYLGIDSFDGEVSARVMSQTNFIELSVTADRPQKAYDLLKAVVAVHSEITEQIFNNATIVVLRNPSMPENPSNAMSTGNRDLIVSGCAIAALAAIILISLMRDTVKNEESFNNKIDSKLIGSILHEDKQMTLQDYRQKKKKSLLLRSNAFISLRFAESFHKIAAKLEYIKKQSNAHVFAITSVAENEGKSTCAANIALSLAERGNRVVLVDLDGKKPALYKIFSEQYEEKNELANLFEHKIRQNEFRLKNYKNSSLFLALNTKAYPEYHEWLENGEISNIINALKSKSDFVIIDTAPLSLDSSVTDIIKLVDKTLLVVRTDTVRASVINDTITTITAISDNHAGCILNDVHPRLMPFSFSGNDESNHYGSKIKGYGKYGKYGGYGRYGKYGRYGHYANNNLNRYGYYSKSGQQTTTEISSDS